MYEQYQLTQIHHSVCINVSYIFEIDYIYVLFCEYVTSSLQLFDLNHLQKQLFNICHNFIHYVLCVYYNSQCFIVTTCTHFFFQIVEI